MAALSFLCALDANKSLTLTWSVFGPRAPTPAGRSASPAFTPSPAGRGFIPPGTTPSFSGGGAPSPGAPGTTPSFSGGGVPSPGAPGTNVPPTGSGFPSSSPQPAPTGTPGPGTTSPAPSGGDTFGLRFAPARQVAVNPPAQQGRQSPPSLPFASVQAQLAPEDRTPTDSDETTVATSSPSPFRQA